MLWRGGWGKYTCKICCKCTTLSVMPYEWPNISHIHFRFL